ncbi:hypothetical protein M3D48_02900 [Dermabacter vaginalis]|uniref:hypothetical protein n=1 Tax=Dermabacter vaginalis TaxID=1630135 RepID=UPI0021A8BDEA|nr:hypothetical protein [Dermabacter vaginalis]MCT2149575.1 hypothetical protein [Dermabacter vaginalis]
MTTEITPSQHAKLQAGWDKLLQDGHEPRDITGELLLSVVKIRRNLAFAFVREQEARSLALSTAPQLTDDIREDLLKSFEPALKAFWEATWPVAKATVEDQLKELQRLCEVHDERALKAEEKAEEAVKEAEAARTSEANMKDKLIKAFQDRDKALAKAAEEHETAVKAEGARDALQTSHAREREALTSAHEREIDALKSAHKQELERLKQVYESKQK